MVVFAALRNEGRLLHHQQEKKQGENGVINRKRTGCVCLISPVIPPPATTKNHPRQRWSCPQQHKVSTNKRIGNSTFLSKEAHPDVAFVLRLVSLSSCGQRVQPQIRIEAAVRPASTHARERLRIRIENENENEVVFSRREIPVVHVYYILNRK